MNKPYVELYIDGQLVEFENAPQIAMTYAHEELHDPTVVKNSFSKTVTINGTPNNNKIFGCFYDMTRITAYGDSNTGAYFNPSKRVPFVLYRNGEKIEEGYVKLDSVKKNKSKIEYSITMYGGLGDMLYCLSYREDGEEMKLSDLDYGVDINIPRFGGSIFTALPDVFELPQRIETSKLEALFADATKLTDISCFEGMTEIYYDETFVVYMEVIFTRDTQIVARYDYTKEQKTMA